jgi:hypothetical protein
MTISVQYTKVTKQTDHAVVELLFAERPDADVLADADLILFRHVSRMDGAPSVEEYALEALQSLRTVLGDEIQRLVRIRGRA